MAKKTSKWDQSGGFVETLTRSCLDIKHVNQHGNARDVKCDQSCSDCFSKSKKNVTENSSELLRVGPTGTEGAVHVPPEASLAPSSSHPAMLSLGEQKPPIKNFMEGMAKESRDPKALDAMLSSQKADDHKPYDVDKAVESLKDSKKRGVSFAVADAANGTDNGHKEEGICAAVLQSFQSLCSCNKMLGDTKASADGNVEMMGRVLNNGENEAHPISSPFRRDQPFAEAKNGEKEPLQIARRR